MRLQKFWFLLFFLATVLIVVDIYIIQLETRFRNQDKLTVSVKQFGNLKLGGEMPLGPGDSTFAPYKIIPISKFYVNIAQKDSPWCIIESCGSVGAQVKTMGGWLEGMESPQAISEIFDLNLEQNNIKSILIVGDQNAKIVGIYPNRGLKDLISILKLYPDLVDFKLLEGVKEYGSLKVGELSPIKPGDPTGHKLGAKTNFPYQYIPNGKKFYIYAFQKNLLGPTSKGYCAFYECLGLEEFDYVEEMGGWFSSDGKPETIRLFGLDSKDVASGKTSLVVVTDSNGIIVAIHPGKTTSDFISILKQLPNLVDVEQIYQ